MRLDRRIGRPADGARRHPQYHRTAFRDGARPSPRPRTNGKVRGRGRHDSSRMSEGTAGVPAPRANPDLLGHESGERELRHLDRLGRLPHAILLCGPRGIGKATLAFRFARFLLAQSADFWTDVLGGPAGSGLAIDAESSVFRRIASGGHADLLTVERAYDPRRRRLRSEILVEDTREIAGFFRLTAAEAGWRIVIVDGAEEMNRNAANALLKILEEPPRRGCSCWSVINRAYYCRQFVRGAAAFRLPR